MSEQKLCSFNRWKPRANTSWAWWVFKKHNDQLMKFYTSFINSRKYTYTHLKQDSAEWDDELDKYFDLSDKWESKSFNNLKEWSESFNDFENWTNLNTLVGISSNLETYIATIVPFAIESDIGVIYGTPHRIDGIEIIKYGKERPLNYDEIISACTKGTWESRINAYQRYFNYVPDYLLQHISELDKIRALRNDVAHAFGRDIAESRRTGEVSILPITRLKREVLLKYQTITWKAAKEIDKHLHNNHIGEYQSLLFYHKIYPELNHDLHPSMRAIELKKRIGVHGDIPAGKDFCKELVDYYESI